MMRKPLFEGGPFDGQYIEIPESWGGIFWYLRDENQVAHTYEKGAYVGPDKQWEEVWFYVGAIGAWGGDV
ncbi:MAG: hypothetical protein GY847_25795 [Proteobacteria bacterium]|nr:hypothetical protein [Pseudomonadota bacterium]